MIHAFLAEREVSKVPGVDKSIEVQTIAEAGIVGAGTMGAGIAMAFANAGIPVRCSIATRQRWTAASPTFARNYESSVKKGRFSAGGDGAAHRVHSPAAYWDGMQSADVIVEAVFEDLALKKSIFAEIDRIAKPDLHSREQHLIARHRLNSRLHLRAPAW